MTIRPKKKKKKAAKKAARKLAPKKNAPKKNAGKAKSRKAAKTRGTKSARPRVTVPKIAPAPKRVAQRRLALLSVSGRRAKSVPNRGPARGRVTARPRVAKPMSHAPRVPGVSVKGALGRRSIDVLTPAALRFLASLHRQFAGARERMSAGKQESGAERPEKSSDATLTVFDFADERFARWSARIEAQVALKGRVSSSTSIVCPRDWDAVEECLLIDGTAMAATLFDFGLSVFHTRNVDPATHVGFCLPGLETEEGASLWHEVVAFAQDQLGIRGDAIVAKSRIEDLVAELQPPPA
jgi:hypothetical protein